MWIFFLIGVKKTECWVNVNLYIYIAKVATRGSSVQDGIYALGKAHVHSTSSQKFPRCCLWNGSNVCLIDDGPLSSFQGRASSTSSFHASLFQAINGVMSLALCLQVVSQAPQHLRSFKKQTTCEGCFACQSICSVISHHSSLSRAIHPQEFS